MKVELTIKRQVKHLSLFFSTNKLVNALVPALRNIAEGNRNQGQKVIEA